MEILVPRLCQALARVNVLFAQTKQIADSHFAATLRQCKKIFHSTAVNIMYVLLMLHLRVDILTG